MSISIKNLTKTYRLEDQELKALDDLNIEVAQGEFLAILGQSGCGKSTLLNILGGMDKPTSGEVIINDENIAKKKPDQLAKFRREQIGMIFQKFNLISDMSLLENVMLPLKFSGFSEKKQKSIAKKVLEDVGLGKRIKSRPGKLSGGQQQRVAIARALVNNPEILLCDEPTGNLDSKTGQGILNLLKGLNEKGHTIIMVTHNEEYGKIADRVVKMLDGQIIEEKINSRDKKVAEFKTVKTNPISYASRFKLAYKNLKRRKLRFFLTSFGVSIGAMAIVVLVSFGAGLQRDALKQVQSVSQVDEIQVSPDKITDVNFSVGPEFSKTESKPLNDKTIEDLAKISNVERVYPAIEFGGEMKYGDKVSILRGESSAPVDLVKDETKAKVAFGKYFSNDSDNSVIIPFGQAKALGFDDPSGIVGKDVTMSVNGKDYKTTIVGVLGEKEKFSFSTILPLNLSQTVLKDKKVEELKKDNPELYGGLTVRAKDSSSVSAVKKAIDDKGYGTTSYEDIAKQMSRVFVIMQMVLGIVGAIALLVASLGITNTMLMAILERTKEIGIMKAVGARAKDISSIFLSEAFLIGLFGGLFGLLLGFGGSKLGETIMNSMIQKSNPDSETISFYIPYYLSLGVVLFSVLVSSVAGFLPARRASKLDPVNALRDE